MASQAPSGNDDNGDKKPPRETTKRTGCECEFVEPPPKQLQSECPICLQILLEPYIVDCCGYSFCAACIERVDKDGKPCPHCNQPGYTILVNKGFKRTLNEFRVYCSHRLSGCEWEGELGKLDEHLNSDQLPERQLEGCPFAVIECPNCKEGIQRDKITGHQLERCPQRPYTRASTAPSTSRPLKTWPTAIGQSASASSCHVQTSAHHLDRASNGRI